MPKKKENKKVDVTGVTIQSILKNYTPKDISKMDEATLRALTSRMASAANKRLKRLEKADETSGYAYQQVYGGRNPLGKFSVKDKNINELRAEFKRAYGFLNLKSSTVKGTKQERTAFQERFEEHAGYDADKFSEADYKRYYGMINKFRELYPDKQYKYDEKVLARMIKGHRSEETIMESMRDTADANYEALQERIAEEMAAIGESDDFQTVSFSFEDLQQQDARRQ